MFFYQALITEYSITGGAFCEEGFFVLFSAA